MTCWLYCLPRSRNGLLPRERRPEVAAVGVTASLAAGLAAGVAGIVELSSCTSHVGVAHRVQLVVALPLVCQRSDQTSSANLHLEADFSMAGCQLACDKGVQKTMKKTFDTLAALEAPSVVDVDSSSTNAGECLSHFAGLLSCPAGLAAIGSSGANVSRTTLPSTPPPTAQQQLVSDTLGVYSTSPRSRCSAAAQALLTALAEGFEESNAQNHSAQLDAGGTPQQPDDPGSYSLKSGSNNLNPSRRNILPAIQFFAQPGFVDFGLAGTPVTLEANSTAGQPSRGSCEPSCSYTNPSAAYGVTVLPLHPSEDPRQKYQTH